MLQLAARVSHLQVCKRGFDLIGSSSSLQYHLELGKARMEDGPPGGMPTAERRKKTAGTLQGLAEPSMAFLCPPV
jgi:hypothetical protein